MGFAPDTAKRPLVLGVLTLLVLWALAVRRAAHLTRENNLIKVRQRQAFRELRGDVRDLRGDAIRGMARATQGTPVGGVFRSNREQDAQAEARTRAAEAEATAAAQAAEAEQQRLDDLAAAEPSPY
jgi:hypothetical protein